MTATISYKMRAMLFAKARQIRLRKENASERIQYLKLHPDDVTEEDYDMFAEQDKRTLRWLFKVQPELEQRYKEYHDRPEDILRTLSGFVRRAWPHIKDPNPYAHNWHIEKICQEYEDIYYGRNDKLIVNQPPGSMKTFLLNIFFPAWVWALDPTRRFASYSYDDSLPKEQKEIFLRLINSQWYQRKCRRLRIISDNKDGLRNADGGIRWGGTVGGPLTGRHPHFMLVDDPHKALDVHSVALMKKAIRWFSGTVASRGMLQKMAIVVCMQRLATNDLCGVILGEMNSGTQELPDALRDVIKESDWRHVCLPMRFNPDHRYRWHRDPRTKKGELLWPAVINEQSVASRIKMMEMDREQANVPAQFNQDPLSEAGTLFENVRGALIRPEDLPKKLVHGMALRGWDRADSKEEADLDPTAGVLIVEFEGIKYIVNRIKFRKTAVDRDNAIEKVSKFDRGKWDQYRVANEVNPGPDGKFAHNHLAARLKSHGIICMSQPATKQKEIRASMLAAGIKYGEVRILDGQDWTGDFVEELIRFPNAPHDDQVDAAAHAYNAIEDWKNGKV